MMVQSCGASDVSWESASEHNKNIVREWMKDEGLDPNHIFRISVVAEGVVEVYCWALNDEGKRYAVVVDEDPRRMVAATAEPFKHSCSTPPPFLMW